MSLVVMQVVLSRSSQDCFLAQSPTLTSRLWALSPSLYPAVQEAAQISKSKLSSQSSLKTSLCSTFHISVSSSRILQEVPA